jgi:alkylation response protein AidB-like acyl-CoA dehydrogenase
VLAAPGATHFIVSAQLHGAVGLAWVASDRPGIARRDYRTVDGGWASELAFDVTLPADALLCEPGIAAQQALERTLDEATLALCAEALGVMHQLQHATTNYARQRKQFGQPIAAFQVLQHRVADMHIARVQAEALTWTSLLQLDADAVHRERAVSSAKVMTSRACRLVGQGAVQIHGGMGMTEELAVGHYFRRATMIEAQFGSVDWHLRRVEQRADGDPRSA